MNENSRLMVSSFQKRERWGSLSRGNAKPAPKRVRCDNSMISGEKKRKCTLYFLVKMINLFPKS